MQQDCLLNLQRVERDARTFHIEWEIVVCKLNAASEMEHKLLGLHLLGSEKGRHVVVFMYVRTTCMIELQRE